MQYIGSIGKLVNQVSEFYKEINPSTLSGAIDVVVAERPDGVLACSPFHVRFGKMQLLRPQEKGVEMRVNDQLIDIQMKLGDAGEAFFVIPSESFVPEELRTSPLALTPRQPLPNSKLEDLNLDEDGNKGFVSPHDAANFDFEKELASAVAANATRDYPLSDSELDVVNKAASLDLAKSTRNDVVSDTEMDYSKFAEDEDPSLPQNQQQWNWRWGGLPIKEDTPIAQNPDNLQSKARLPQRVDRIPRTVESRNIDLDVLKEFIDDFLGGRLSQSNVQMSLCGQLCSDLKVFEQCFVSSQAFASNPLNVLCDPQLVFNINGRYYTWHVIAPLLVSQAVFGQGTLSDEHLQSLAIGPTLLRSTARSESPVKTAKNSPFMPDSQQFGQVQQFAESKLSESAPSSFSGGWKQWWNTRQKSPDKLTVSLSEPVSPIERATAAPQNQQENPESNKKIVEVVIDEFNANELTRNNTMPKIGIDNRPSPLNIQRPLSAPVPLTDAQQARLNLESQAPQYAKTLRLTSEQLKSLNLKYGPNDVKFSVVSSYSGLAVCTARIFLWRYDVQVVVSDIDGTVTKSDALGHLLPIFRLDWTHPGIAHLYTSIMKNGYQILYLTSRAIGQADSTRGYLKGVEQGGRQLPDGPVIMSPDRLIAALKREVIFRRPEEFKIAVLKDIRALFSVRNPFYAGFGNRVTDAMSYRAVDIPAYRIYSIDSNGEIKMDFFVGYSSSYIKLADLVDHIFPPIRTSRHKHSLSTASIEAMPGTPRSQRTDTRNNSFSSTGSQRVGLGINARRQADSVIPEEQEDIGEGNLTIVDGAYKEGDDEPFFDTSSANVNYSDFSYWRSDSYQDIPLPAHITQSKEEEAISQMKDPRQRFKVLRDLPQHSQNITKDSQTSSSEDEEYSDEDITDEDLSEPYEKVDSSQLPSKEGADK